MLNKLSNEAYREAYLRWVNIQKWENPYAVTLTLKQSIALKKLNFGQTIQITPDIAAQNVNYFLYTLDRSSFGNQATRYDKQVDCFSVFEQSDSKDLHYHMAMNRPAHITDAAFRFKIRKCWTKTIWGNRQMDIQSSADNGWIEYMMKPKDKEDYQVSVDLLNTRF